MRRPRSSIFSFDTLRLQVPFRPWRNPLFLALAIVAVLEGGARVELEPVGRNWEYWNVEAAVKFEGYRNRIERGDIPGILVVGDSTGAADIDPTVIAEQVPRGADAYNLAWPGNFAFAFRCNTVPLLTGGHPVPKLIIASFDPARFVDNDHVRQAEGAILACPYCRHQRGEWLLADYVYLARVPASMPFKERAKSKQIEQGALNKGFMPLDGVGDGDAIHGAAEVTWEVFSSRFSPILDLAGVATTLVVVIPPRQPPSEFRIRMEEMYIRKLKEAATNARLTVLDWRAPTFLEKRHFVDANHLNREGAALFSQQLAMAIRPYVESF